MNIKVGDEVEILISSYEFDLYAGSVVEVANIIYDKQDTPILAIVILDDGTTRRICIDHIRFPK